VNTFCLIYELAGREWFYRPSTQHSVPNFFFLFLIFPLTEGIKISTSGHHLGV